MESVWHFHHAKQRLARILCGLCKIQVLMESCGWCRAPHCCGAALLVRWCIAAGSGSAWVLPACLSWFLWYICSHPSRLAQQQFSLPQNQHGRSQAVISGVVCTLLLAGSVSGFICLVLEWSGTEESACMPFSWSSRTALSCTAAAALTVLSYHPHFEMGLPN